ncbi:hypothetical protein GCM10023231_41980 [Olivibacter ginsenosidimutans]|uniref:Cytochrome c n=1 Tax=Olivibacter ginsenosidimutans TaxID=1176537 RepID=A0ABP9CCF5_9SPHI
MWFKQVYKIVALYLLVILTYLQVVQVVHAYQHNDSIQQTELTSFQFKKEIHCKICHHLHSNQIQQLPGKIFTLSEVYRKKPILIQRLDLAKPFEIPLSSCFNKGPPLI